MYIDLNHKKVRGMGNSHTSIYYKNLDYEYQKFLKTIFHGVSHLTEKHYDNQDFIY